MDTKTPTTKSQIASAKKLIFIFQDVSTLSRVICSNPTRESNLETNPKQVFDFAWDFYKAISLKQFEQISQYAVREADACITSAAEKLSATYPNDERYSARVNGIKQVIEACMVDAFNHAANGSHVQARKDIFDALTSLDLLFYTASSKIAKA